MAPDIDWGWSALNETAGLSKKIKELEARVTALESSRVVPSLAGGSATWGDLSAMLGTTEQVMSLGPRPPSLAKSHSTNMQNVYSGMQNAYVPPQSTTKMREIAKQAAVDVHRALAPLTPGERVDLLFHLEFTYCHRCGFPPPPNGPCKCAADVKST